MFFKNFVSLVESLLINKTFLLLFAKPENEFIGKYFKEKIGSSIGSPSYGKLNFSLIRPPTSPFQISSDATTVT